MEVFFSILATMPGPSTSPKPTGTCNSQTLESVGSFELPQTQKCSQHFISSSYNQITVLFTAFGPIFCQRMDQITVKLGFRMYFYQNRSAFLVQIDSKVSPHALIAWAHAGSQRIKVLQDYTNFQFDLYYNYIFSLSVIVTRWTILVTIYSNWCSIPACTDLDKSG